MSHQKYLQRAVQLAIKGMRANRGGPFGCLVVKEEEIIGRGVNSVTSTNDPTAHAEIAAIRDACRHLGSFQLSGCTIYSSCEPCPMCLGAIYWARPEQLFYAATRQDAAAAGFDDDMIYRELTLNPDERTIPMQRVSIPETDTLFEEWRKKEDKLPY